jgi:amino acid transporter
MIGLVVQFVLPLDELYHSSGDMLAVVGDELGGSSFKTFICVDSVIILCGAVLASYVGTNGLVRRLAQDNVLPQFLLTTNSRGSQHWCSVSFFFLTSALFLTIYKPGDESGIETFGGVYAIAFLLVMAFFAISCIALKVQRPTIARLVVTDWWETIFCLCCVTIGIIGQNSLLYLLLHIYDRFKLYYY